MSFLFVCKSKVVLLYIRLFSLTKKRHRKFDIHTHVQLNFKAISNIEECILQWRNSKALCRFAGRFLPCEICSQRLCNGHTSADTPLTLVLYFVELLVKCGYNWINSYFAVRMVTSIWFVTNIKIIANSTHKKVLKRKK